jgi:hypothetical protein
MELLAICTIVFFGVFGISQFVPFRHSDIILGIAAIAIAIISFIVAV